MGSNRLLAAGIAALALALGATGCTSTDDPDPTPTNSASPAESASTTPSPTVSPSQVAQETAEEFIRRWPIFEHQMLVTGDTAEYRALTKGCEFCAGLASRVEGFYAQGGWVKAEPWTIKAIRRAGGTKAKPVFDVFTVAKPSRYKESESAEPTALPGGEPVLQVTLKRTGAQWRITYYSELAQ